MVYFPSGDQTCKRRAATELANNTRRRSITAVARSRSVLVGTPLDGVPCVGDVLAGAGNRVSSAQEQRRAGDHEQDKGKQRRSLAHVDSFDSAVSQFAWFEARSGTPN